ncbi:mercury methylation ferredoxin HgcB [Desulfosediminicola flagellatus]|uniref:mercury methylation ferredoxin HgcB n=1 Tax=Desulfosediminicola flagellatus TaxID=2569541 RepID=UPI0010AB53FA|nr:mercury methylation ferredoxin HgcB [Desulfosediminicola flagellatus]
MKKLRYLEKLPILSLDTERCIGCGMCETTCPHRIFSIENGKAKLIDKGACMECGACATNCPVNAITVNEEEGCGCATLIISSWISKFTGKPSSGSCC